MARRKTRKPKANWDEEDWIELLAWLDYTLKCETSFEDTIIGHLKDSRNQCYSLIQITSKLGRLWDGYGGEDVDEEKKKIFVRGSACLKLLPDSHKEAIFTRSTILAHSELAKQLSKGRSLRSATSIVSERHISLESLKPDTRRPQRRRQSYSASPGKRKRELSTTASSEQFMPKDEVAMLAMLPSHQVNPMKTHETQQPSRRPLHRSSPRLVGDSEAEPSSSVEVPDESHGGDEKSMDEVDFPPPVAQARVEMNPKRTPEEIEHRAVLKGRLRRRIRQKDAEIEELKTQLTQSQNQTRVLENDLEYAESARIQRERAGDGNIEETIYEKDRFIGQLKHELSNRRMLGTFTKLSSVPSLRPQVTNINQGMNQIEHEMKQILFAFDDKVPLNVPSFDENGTLKILVYRGLGLNPDKPIQLEPLTLCLSKLTPQPMIRALTASALREWVFETDFPGFDRKPSTLFVKYREHIETQDGPTALNNLDQAAYSSLIDDSHFRENTISRRAEKLASRLFKVLSSFSPYDNTNLQTSALQTWEEDHNDEEDRRSRLMTMFDIALRLKADSLLNNELYEMDLCTPGTAYDEKTMEIDSIVGTEPYALSYKDFKVQLCLRPSILAYTRGSSEESTRLSTAIVEPQNFIRRNSSQLGQAKVLTKAIVILEKPPVINSGFDSDSDSALTELPESDSDLGRDDFPVQKSAP